MNSTIPQTRALKRRPQVSASPLRHVSRPALTAFNPALPVDDSLVVAGELRDQFNGLKDLIDAIQTITAAVVDATNTLPAGDPAAVTLNVADGTLHFTFNIPAGPQGSNGSNGSNGSDGAPGQPGPQGEQGPQGEPGQVSLVQLTDAIATTSSNSNAVTTLGMVVSDPPTQGEVQLIADKVDELINALRR